MTTIDGIDVSFTPDQMAKAKQEERAAVAVAFNETNTAITQSARTADISSLPESPTRKLRERKPSGDSRDNNTHHASKHHRRSSSSSSSSNSRRRSHKRTSSRDMEKDRSNKEKEKNGEISKQPPPLTDRNRMTDEEYEAALRQPKHLRSRSLAEKIDFERQFRARKAEEERKAQTDNVFSRLRETSDLRSQKLAEMETERKARVEAELERQKQTIIEQAEAERAKKKLLNTQRELQHIKPKTESGQHSRKTSLELEEEEAERVAKGLDPTPATHSSRMSLGDRVAAQIMDDKRNGRSGTSISASPVDSTRVLDKSGSAAPAYFSKPSDELLNKQTINRQDSLRDFEKDRATTRELQNSIAEARVQLEEEEKFEKARRAKEKLDELEKQKKNEEEKRRLEEEEKRNEVLRKKQEAIKAFEEKRRWEKLTNEEKVAEEAEKARIAAEEAARKKKEEEERLAEIARKKAAEEAAAAEPEVVSFQFHGADESDDEGTDKKPEKNDVKTPQATTETTTSTPAKTQEKEKEKVAKEKAAAKEFAAADAAANPEPAKVTGCKCLIM